MSYMRHKKFIVALSVLFWLLVWQACAAIVHNPVFLASPVETLQALVELVPTAVFWESVAHTFFSIFLGFVLAFICGVTLGTYAQRHPLFVLFIRPVMGALKSIPVACMVVILLLWAGSARLASVVVFLLVFPAYYESGLHALKHMDTDAARVFLHQGLSKLRFFLAYGWPHMLSYIEASSKSIVGMSWKAGVAAEVIGLLTNTLGDGVYQAKLVLATDKLFALTLAIVLLAAISEKLWLLVLDLSRIFAQKLACALAPQHAELCAPQPLFGIAVSAKACLMASTGAGKTTLIKQYVDEHPVQRISYIPQRLVADEKMSVKEYLYLVVPKDEREQADNLYAKAFPSKTMYTRPLSTLSGGEKHVIALLQALLAHTSACIFDEPFQGLDSCTKKQMCELIAKYVHERTLLITTHDTDDVYLLDATLLTLASKELYD